MPSPERRSTVPRENASAKAARLLAEGRLIVHRAGPDTTSATCRGEGTVHRLGYLGGTWWCSCRVRTDVCSHLIALRRVTAPDIGDDR